MDQSDGFVVHHNHRKSKVPPAKRLYIGNLSHIHDDNQQKQQIQQLLQENAKVAVAVINITIQQTPSSCCALINMLSDTDMETVIQKLHGIELEGKQLIAERERRTKVINNGTSRSGPKKAPPSQFGRKGWSRPKKGINTMAPTASRNCELVERPREAVEDEPMDDSVHPSHEEKSSTLEQPLLLGDETEPLNGTVKSSSEMTPSLYPDHMNNKSMDEPDKNVEGNDPSDDQPTSWSDVLQKPLSDLLDGYGEADPNWAQQVETTTTTLSSKRQDSEMVESMAVVVPESRLAMQGKASIHVELVSFGYLHGVPKEIRKGWSHAQPLPLLDCRDLPTVPPYLNKMDGLSFAVKRAITNPLPPPQQQHHHNDKTRNKKNTTTTTDSTAPPLRTTPTKIPVDAKQHAKQLAGQILEALQDAMSAGGHGPVSPLHMTIYCGSESGRHRSVVVCELAATALRRLLRLNHPANLLPYSCSVGTRHRELERKSNSREVKNNSSDDV